MQDETTKPSLDSANNTTVSQPQAISPPVSVDTTAPIQTATTTVAEVFPEEADALLSKEAKALSDTENVQGGLTIDTSNNDLDKLSTETLLEKRKALLWIATTGATKNDSVFFFQGELGPIEMELVRRGIKLN